jgi:hypothetical protein
MIPEPINVFNSMFVTEKSMKLKTQLIIMKRNKWMILDWYGDLGPLQ